MYKRLFLIVTTLFLFACSSDSTVETDLNTTSTKPSEAIVAKPIMLSKPVMAAKPKTTAEEVLSENQIKKLKQEAPTLASAIALYNNKDSIDSGSNNSDISELLRNLILWDGIVGMTWEDLNSIPETSYEMIKKDIFTETGKRFCFTGTVHKIEVDRSINPPLTQAFVYAAFRGYVSVIAVGSSGDILPSSEVNFCGVVTGDGAGYETFAGGDSAPYLLGMFDLPENK
ncbi:hypothetical protein SAMN04488491_2268 [Psychrobacter sp. LV10R520-6]|nr:hypothetical protein SAMN04488491_2268 [Psychrobacter sp. LV10R520-6]